MNYRVICELAEQYSIEEMCRYLKVSRSGYYEWLKRGESLRTKSDRELSEKIRDTFTTFRGRYGSPRIYSHLRDMNVYCSRKRVERLMREIGLKARCKRKFKITTNSNHNYPIAPNLLNRQFEVDKPNRVWVSDITYISTFEGWLYLAIVMDLYSRRIVGWAMSKNINTELALAALKMAIKNRRPSKGLIHHSDRGVQYASNDYQVALNKHNITCSMSRKGNCWDNAPAESFFSTLKTELIGDKIYLSRAQAQREIFEFIEIYYNRMRRHSTINSMTPENFENLRLGA
jgi:transposase InsO family protein